MYDQTCDRRSTFSATLRLFAAAVLMASVSCSQSSNDSPSGDVSADSALAPAPNGDPKLTETPAAEDESAASDGSDSSDTPEPTADQEKVEWTSLFNGKNLEGWKVTEFGGEGEVEVKDGQMVIDIGNPLSGVNYTGKTPKTNYEVELDAMRVSGSDFFCGLTFPVKDDPCSLILGGWGGGLIGLSSINGMDASENETTNYKEFKNGQWYSIRLRVLDDRILAWVDDEEVVDQDLTDRKISVRIEVELSEPFGLATYETRAAVRNFRLRTLSEKEVAAAKSPPAPTESE